MNEDNVKKIKESNLRFQCAEFLSANRKKGHRTNKRSNANRNGSPKYQTSDNTNKNINDYNINKDNDNFFKLK